MEYRTTLHTSDFYSSFKCQISFSESNTLTFENYKTIGSVCIESTNALDALKSISCFIFAFAYCTLPTGTFTLREHYGGAGYGPHPGIFEAADQSITSYLSSNEIQNMKDITNTQEFVNIGTLAKKLFSQINLSRDIFYFFQMASLYNEFLEQYTTADKAYFAGYRLLETLTCWQGLSHKKTPQLPHKLSLATPQILSRAINQWKNLRNSLLGHFSISPYVLRTFQNDLSSIMNNPEVPFERQILENNTLFDSYTLLNYPERDLDDILIRHLISTQLNIDFYDTTFRGEFNQPNEGTCAFEIYQQLIQKGTIHETYRMDEVFMG